MYWRYFVCPCRPWRPPEAGKSPCCGWRCPPRAPGLCKCCSVEAVWIPLRLQASGLAAREATARLGMLSGMVTPVLMLPCVFTGSLSMVLLPRIALAEKEPKELRRLVGKCFLTAAPAGLGSTGAVWLAAPLLARWLYRLPELTPLFRFGAPLCLLFAFAHVSGGILSALGLQKLSMLGSLPVSGLTLLLASARPAGAAAVRRTAGTGGRTVLHPFVESGCAVLPSKNAPFFR